GRSRDSSWCIISPIIIQCVAPVPMNADGLWSYVIRSIVVALICFGVPLFSSALGAKALVALTVLLTLLWLVMVGSALHRLRWRGLWVWLGAPLALAGPCATVGLNYLCSHGGCL